MTYYDFSPLSAYEFELLSRDLLQKHLGLQFESFKSGRDQGIDLRHCSTIDGTTVVQCKRYVESDFSDLVRACTAELPKITAITPARYILVTSLGLSPTDKSKLQTVLAPYLVSPADIYGREDLNNLLGQHKDIERAHFKLWLHSFEVLQNVFHSATLNFTAADRERIEKKRRYYVPTAAFNEALKILNEKHYCVITGIPGIGKTTLAEMLLLAHGKHGYDIIKVSSDIKEGFALVNKEKRQLFYYDDFLGQTGLTTKLGKNEDDRLLAFISVAASSKHTRFLLTTREYVLKQAQTDYERLSRFDFEKCVIEPPKYSEFERARILYNHLHFADLPADYKQAVLADRNYLQISEHRGFNPRLIETMTSLASALRVPAIDYVRKFVSVLENPEELWSHAYNNQISQAAKDLLLVLVSLPRTVLLSDLEAAFQGFHFSRVTRFAMRSAPNAFHNALQEIEDTFVRIEKTRRNNVSIEFHNPSVRDFMETHLSDNLAEVQQLVAFAQYFEQLEYLLTPDSKENKRRRIRSHALLESTLVDQLIARFHSSSAYLKFSWHDNIAGDNEPVSHTERLWLVAKLAADLSAEKLFEFMKTSLLICHAEVTTGKVDHEELIMLLEVLEDCPDEVWPNDWKAEFLSDCKDHLLSDLTEFSEYHTLVEHACKSSYWTNPDMKRIGSDFDEFFYSQEDDLLDDGEFDDKMAIARDISKKLNLSLSARIDRLEEKRDTTERGGYVSSGSTYTAPDSRAKITAEIDSMFASLMD